jgi:lipooligosaccharide transport system permease protein
VAPALLAASSMNGAITESTFNFFFKLNYDKTFASILTTPMSPGDISIGELCWALIRGALYTLGFLVVMLLLGLAQSPLVIFTIPGALLIGFAFASVGMAATSFMRTWQDFDLIQLVVLPMFLFSGTFFPIDAYPDALRILIQITPLYRGVDLLRSSRAPASSAAGEGTLAQADGVAIRVPEPRSARHGTHRGNAVDRRQRPAAVLLEDTSS